MGRLRLVGSLKVPSLMKLLRASVVDSFLLTRERHGTSRKIPPYRVMFASRYCDEAYELIEQVSMLKKQDNDG